MYFEAKGSYQEAEDILKKELAERPESQLLLKRKVALEKTQDNLAGAIDALRKYIDIFQTDREAWEELGDLYLQACAFLCLGHLAGQQSSHDGLRASMSMRTGH
jgi:tetratricopeptide (TPR) repeat protein